MKHVEVVAGALFVRGRMLATCRGEGDFKGFWEFPGGKIEPGETHHETLKREFAEELGLVVIPGSHIIDIEHTYDTRLHVVLHCYRCELGEPALQNLTKDESGYPDLQACLSVHKDYAWLTLDDLFDKNWLSADIEILDEIARHPEWFS